MSGDPPVDAMAAAATPGIDEIIAEETRGVPIRKRPDMSPRDYVVQLLSFGAHIEHALLVQYLYAAYSLRADLGDREKIERWRSNILSVAKEEMGHLLTVQNILTLLGAPVDFGRDYSKWARDVNPFPFSLEPFSLDVLVRFIFAEMPPEGEEIPTVRGKKRTPNFKAPSGDGERDIQKEIDSHIERLGLREKGHRVGATYAEIIRLLQHPKLPDSCFDEASYEFQASSDEWGRNYRPALAQLTPEGDRVAGRRDDAPSDRHAYVQVARVATRNDAIKALRELSSQGEAPHLRHDESGEPSHYDRFVEIYLELGADDAPARDVISNPTTRAEFAGHGPDGDNTLIKAWPAHLMAQLFNQRYRLLLAYLAHGFHMAPAMRPDRPNLRSMIMHRAFGEMYNLKTIAGILVQLRVSGDPNDPRLAAPPFELPPSLALPDRELDIWRAHRDLLATSKRTIGQFFKCVAAPSQEQAALRSSEAYARTLLAIDAQTEQWIENIMAGAAGRRTGH